MNLQRDQNSSEHDGQDNHNHRIRMRPFPLPYPALPTTIYVVIARRGQLHRHLDRSDAPSQLFFASSLCSTSIQNFRLPQ